MQHGLAIGAALGGMLCAAASGAQDFDDTPDAAKVTETARVTVYTDHADWVITCSATNPSSERRSLVIHSSGAGVVGTGLTVETRQHGVVRWVAARLVPQEDAEARFEPREDDSENEVSAVSASPDGVTGMMGQSEMGLDVEIEPLEPHQSRRFQYRFRTPVSYADGTYWAGFGELARVGHVIALNGVADADLIARDHVVTSGATVPWASERVGVRPRHPPAFAGALDVVPLGTRTFARFHVDAARDLAPVSTNAHLVILIDRSRSMGARAIRAAQATARAVLSHLPRAQAAVGYVARTTEWTRSGFVAGSKLSTDLSAPVEALNGSSIDDALRDAVRRLEGLRGLKRIVVLTDGLTPRRVSPERLEAIATQARSTVLHIGIVQSGPPGIARRDVHAWTDVGRPTLDHRSRTRSAQSSVACAARCAPRRNPGSAAALRTGHDARDRGDELRRNFRRAGVPCFRARGSLCRSRTLERDALSHGVHRSLVRLRAQSVTESVSAAWTTPGRRFGSRRDRKADVAGARRKCERFPNVALDASGAAHTSHDSCDTKKISTPDRTHHLATIYAHAA